ncbi:MAG: riboflavin kinase, partial [Phycisphaerales bacterium]
MPDATADTCRTPHAARRGAVVMIGNFDGVHVGHTALARTVAAAATGPGACALVFDPHPLALLRPADAPARLTTFEDREALLRAAGVGRVIRLVPEPQMLERSPAQFVDWLVQEHAPYMVVEGADFCFGKGRSGNVALLAELGAARGFEVRVVPPVQVVLDDHSVVKASSSLCRWLISHGRVADAARVLGRRHTLVGTVVQGDRRGRTIGFPTANIDTPVLLPADGVYAARAVLPDGRAFPAAANIGERP